MGTFIGVQRFPIAACGVPLFALGRLGFAIQKGIGLFIRGNHARAGTAFDGHVADGHAAFHGEIADGFTGKFDDVSLCRQPFRFRR